MEPDTSATAPLDAPRSRIRRALDAVDDRMGISALAYPVPEHANRVAWSLGGITSTALMVLLVPGIILAQFFAPVPESANQSVRDIMTKVWAGYLIRGVHFWSAQAMYVTAALHLIRVFPDRFLQEAARGQLARRSRRVRAGDPGPVLPARY